MKRITSVTIGALLAMGMSGRAEGQELRLTLSGGRLADERGESRTGMALGGSLLWSGAGSVAGLGAQLSVLGGEAVQGSGGGWGRVTVAEHGALALLAGGEGWVGSAGPGHRIGLARGDARLRLRAGRLSLETGPRLAVGVGRQDGSAAPGAPFGLGAEGASETVRRTERGWEGAAWVDAGALGVRAGWALGEGGDGRWTDWTAEGTLEVGGALLAARGGVRRGALREEWVGAHLGVELGSRAAIVLDAGGSPCAPLTGRPAGSHASAGIALRVGGPS